MTVIVGLTGGIATGKSTVAKMFEDEGIPVIDTDSIARELLEKGTDVYTEVVRHFSSEILFTNQDINRKKLGRIVFTNPGKRQLLNDIVHPAVRRITLSEIEQYKELNTPIVCVDVPLLFETDFHTICDKTVVVYTTKERQVSRLMERDRIEEDYALAKIQAQMPLEEKVARADYVIDNSQSILQTKKDFLHILQDLEVD